MNANAAGQRPDGTYPSPLMAWWGCIVLTLGCILAFADRAILNLFVTPIQRDLHLSDTQISLVIGLAFAVFNAVFGLPVGRWVDSWSRTRIAALGITAWSLATAGCGLATNFWQLFAGRAAVGVGEATVTPAGVSLLADLFPPARRGLPVGIFYGGIFIGSGGALVIGGLLWRALGDRIVTLPLLGEFHSWQVVLMIVGAAGLVVAPLTLTLREPIRKGSEGQAHTGAIPLAEVVRFYRTHARTLVGHNLGFCFYNFTLHAGAAWLPTLLVRNYGWSLAQAGATFGLMMLVLGPAGSATSGLLADTLCRRGRSDGKFLVAMGAAGVLIAVCAALANQLPTAGLLAALACFAFFGTFSLPLAAGALQDVMPNAMRGQAIAVYVALTNIVAGGFAATAVALITDYVFHDPKMLGAAFGAVGVTACTLALAVLFNALPSYRRTLADLAAEASPPGAPIPAATPAA